MAEHAPLSLELLEWPWDDLQRPSWHEKAFDILKDFVDKNHHGYCFDTACRLAELMPEPGQKGPWMAVGELNIGDFVRGIAAQLHYTSPVHILLVSLFMHLGRLNSFNDLNDLDYKTVTRNITRAWQKDVLYLMPWCDYICARGHAFVPEAYEIKAPGTRSRTVNAAAFDARLLSAGLYSGGYHERWVVNQLQAALENKPETNPGLGGERRKEAWRAELLGAAMQPIFAGQMLFDCIVIDPLTPDKPGGVYHTGDIYHGPEWGIERWRFWRQRFTEIAVDERDADAEVSRVCYKAADMMMAIERNYLY